MDALDMVFDPDRTSQEVTIPTADLLGEDGHRYRTGWRLEPVDGSMNVARANREAWIAAKARLAKRDDDHEMQVFKAELREALRDPGKLPGDELSESVEYTDGSDEAFLRRLWRDLYGDESPDAPGSRVS